MFLIIQQKLHTSYVSIYKYIFKIIYDNKGNQLDINGEIISKTLSYTKFFNTNSTVFLKLPIILLFYLCLVDQLHPFLHLRS